MIYWYLHWFIVIYIDLLVFILIYLQDQISHWCLSVQILPSPQIQPSIVYTMSAHYHVQAPLLSDMMTSTDKHSKVLWHLNTVSQLPLTGSNKLPVDCGLAIHCQRRCTLKYLASYVFLQVVRTSLVDDFLYSKFYILYY